MFIPSYSWESITGNGPNLSTKDKKLIYANEYQIMQPEESSGPGLVVANLLDTGTKTKKEVNRCQ